MNKIDEALWQPVDYAVHDLCAQTWSWIQNPDSLTARLQDFQPHHLEFHVIGHGMGDITAEEQAALCLKQSQHWIREIEWRCQGELWIAARTIIPQIATPSVYYAALLNAGLHSIGSLLFQLNGFQRSPIEVARLPISHHYSKMVFNKKSCNHEMALWARRSIFKRKDEKLLVTEIFLPAFFAAVTNV